MTMKLANIAMPGCLFVTCIHICKLIMFTVQSDYHGTRFPFQIGLKPQLFQTVSDKLLTFMSQYIFQSQIHAAICQISS